MTPRPITEDELLDAIHNSVAISSGPAATLVSFPSDVIRVWDDTLGMNFVVRIAKSLSFKEESDRQQKIVPRFPFLPPFEPGLYVCDLDADHRVLLNKFNVVADHILVVSSAFQPQNEPLSPAMLAHVAFCVRALGGLAFHNHGPESGASQPHLHVQVVPRFESAAVGDAPLTDLMGAGDDALFDAVGCLRRFPIRHRAVRFRAGEFAADAVDRHYRVMLDQLDLTAGSSYNFLLTSEYMMIVPRRARAHQGIGVNSVAFAGLMFLQSERQLPTLEEIGGPGQLLRQLAYPADAAAL